MFVFTMISEFISWSIIKADKMPITKTQTIIVKNFSHSKFILKLINNNCLNVTLSCEPSFIFFMVIELLVLFHFHQQVERIQHFSYWRIAFVFSSLLHLDKFQI